ncbi:MAG: class I SAM-dependent methyltransferase [Pirellulales bacterium]
MAVENGIVRFYRPTNDNSLEESRKWTEMQRRDSGADVYEKYFSKFATSVEKESILAALQPSADDVVIELGVGTGRMASAYAPLVRGVLGVDLSRRSLEIARSRLEAVGAKFCLVQSDVCRLPIKTGCFGKAVSPEVFEHLLSAQARNDGLAEAARILGPGGRFIITVYHYSMLKRLRNALQSGRCLKEDYGPDYAFSFSRSEFKEWLSSHFEVESITGIRSAILERLPVLGRFGLWGERAVSTSRKAIPHP